MEKNNFISVVICTYNRSHALCDTLHSLSSQNYDGKFNYEIVVVDNNSKDKTKELVANYISKFDGRLRYIFEVKQGLSNARNKGINESKGNIIAFTDDDCILDKNWLKNIDLSFSRSKPDCVGGKIIPIFEGKIPNWFSDKLRGKLALLDYGNESFEIKSEKYTLFGANFAIRKKVLLKFGLFNTDLGRVKNKLFGQEDTEFMKRLIKENACIYYDPLILVRHKIGKDRISKNYFRKWHFYSAISYAKSNSFLEVKKLFCLPRYMIREFLASALFLLRSFLLLNKKDAFYYECKLIFFLSFFLFKIRNQLNNNS